MLIGNAEANGVAAFRLSRSGIMITLWYKKVEALEVGFISSVEPRKIENIYQENSSSGTHVKSGHESWLLANTHIKLCSHS